MTLWQVKHDTVPLDDSRGSKYSILPSSTLSAVVGLSAGAGATSGNACHGPLAAAAGVMANGVEVRTIAAIATKRMALLPETGQDADTLMQPRSLHKSEKYRTWCCSPFVDQSAIGRIVVSLITVTVTDELIDCTFGSFDRWSR